MLPAPRVAPSVTVTLPPAWTWALNRLCPTSRSPSATTRAFCTSLVSTFAPDTTRASAPTMPRATDTSLPASTTPPFSTRPPTVTVPPARTWKP